MRFIEMPRLIGNTAYFRSSESVNESITVYEVPMQIAIEVLTESIENDLALTGSTPPLNLLNKNMDGFLLLLDFDLPENEDRTSIDIDELYPSETYIAFKHWENYTLIYPEEYYPEDNNTNLKQIQVFDNAQKLPEGLHRIKCEYWVKDKWRKYVKRLHCAYSINGCISHSCKDHCDEMQVNERGNVKGLLCRCGE